MPYIPGASTTGYTTADVQMVATGRQVRVFNMHIISAGTVAVVDLKTGGSGGTIRIQQTGAAVSTGTNFNYGTEGVVFPSGLYVNVDANTTSVSITYAVELA